MVQSRAKISTRAALRAAAVAALLATACSAPIQTNSMVAPNANLPARATYAWQEPAGGPLGASVIAQYVKAAVNQQLAAKGYQPAGMGAPGFLMDFRMMAREQASLEGFGGGFGGGTLDTIHYTKGTLIVGARDPASGQALWQGYASTIVDPEQPQADATKRIDEAVAKMFESFPAR
jgi:hypothetical protein